MNKTTSINLSTLEEERQKTRLLFACMSLALVLGSSEVFAVGAGPDAGLNTSVTNLSNILNNSLVPVVLICGCLAGAAFSFMKSSPTPLIVALITTASFGFSKSWIGGTYALLV